MKLLIVLFISCLTKVAFCQHVADTFQSAEGKGYSMQMLDKQYPPAVGAGNVVFKGADEPKLITAYTLLLNDLAKYLNQNGYRWNIKTRIFNRVYFEPDGSISYYLVNLAPTGIAEEKKQQFLTLLNKFIQHYKIKITAKSRFAQCSPVTYADVI